MTCSAECRRARLTEKAREHARRNPRVRPTRVVLPRDCRICGQSFTPKTSQRQICSKECANRSSGLRRLGVSPEQYRALVVRAAGRCEMCGLRFGDREGDFSPWPGSHAVDHCHKTGDVRGLLCGRCNVALGRFEGVKAAAEWYLAFTSLDLLELCAR